MDDTYSFKPLEHDLPQPSSDGVYGVKYEYVCDVDKWDDDTKNMFLEETLKLITGLIPLPDDITQERYDTVMARAEKTAIVRKKKLVDGKLITDFPLKPTGGIPKQNFDTIIDWYKAKSGYKHMTFSDDKSIERTGKEKRLYDNYLRNRSYAKKEYEKRLMHPEGGKRTRHKRNRGRKKKTRRNRRAKY